jgi:hypothetical protein
MANEKAAIDNSLLPADICNIRCDPASLSKWNSYTVSLGARSMVNRTLQLRAHRAADAASRFFDPI